MEAIQFIPTSKKVQLTKIDKPKIVREDDVLIKVAYAGICGTDLHIMAGEFPCKPEGALTLGHEISGIVVEVGSKVTEISVGDNVAIDPNNGCHCCNTCKLGNPHFCAKGSLDNTIGIFRNGGWANYVLVPEEQVSKTNSPLNQAVLTEPISCILQGFNRLNTINIGERILITGAGIIGQLWAAILHFKGHRRITISEPNQSRLNFLKKLGYGFECLTPQELDDKSGKRSFDLAIDCSGNVKAIEQAFNLLDKGGRLCQFGVANPEAKITISPYEIFKKELTILGAVINPFCIIKAIDLIEAMNSQNYLDYEKLGIKTFSLTEYNRAFEELKEGKIAKAVFKMQEQE